MTTTPDDNDPNYDRFMNSFRPESIREGEEDPTEDLGPTSEDFGASLPWEAQESNSEARLIGRRSGDMLREFLANGFTRQEAIMFICQMLPHHPH
ncbi:hypothetical protein SEA_MAMAPEARL_41 [Arthrobacter phage MamaPearl]|uniref:Uncharacterized protein n=1 Tax=Arthrobacter phage MamaPearl TaxID=2743906 RepID=A0AAE7F7J4_9CAUD|nr:hypothetical protein KDJ03_gp41 [Arthrobacter phage MamaPearl]QDH48229.1 hypothetical protein SEA_ESTEBANJULIOR_41 [Arthrobacter phage EstebanJulior]QKY79111.1 hypothetical protein SEA_MAMAPEARL_41 [Arthrobacter phage MamaPearl]